MFFSLSRSLFIHLFSHFVSGAGGEVRTRAAHVATGRRRLAPPPQLTAERVVPGQGERATIIACKSCRAGSRSAAGRRFHLHGRRRENVIGHFLAFDTRTVTSVGLRFMTIQPLQQLTSIGPMNRQTILDLPVSSNLHADLHNALTTAK